MRRAPQRRKLVWATANNSHTVAAGGKFNDDLLANLEVAGSSVLGATVMRIHSRIAITCAANDAALGLFVGFIVDTAPTVTNLDPSVAFGDNWMLLSEISPSVGKNQMLNGTSIFYGDEFDIRSKRKVQELGEKLFLCGTSAHSTSITIGTFTRTLIALP